MKGVTRFILLRVLIITLIQFACLGLWCLFFIILTSVNSPYSESSFVGVILDWGIFAGIIALNVGLSGAFLETTRDFSEYFIGQKLRKNYLYSIANQSYSKAKPVIVIVHLAVIVLFNFACGMLKSDSGHIQTVILAFPTVVYRTIFRVVGTVCFIVSMVRYCKSIINAKLEICPNCGKVTWYYANRTATLRESWTETVYRTSSYTTTEKIGELRDSSGNSCDVYGDVEHYNDDSRDIYHPGLYEYEYQCKFCGYKFKGTSEQ